MTEREKIVNEAIALITENTKKTVEIIHVLERSTRAFERLNRDLAVEVDRLNAENTELRNQLAMETAAVN